MADPFRGLLVKYPSFTSGYTNAVPPFAVFVNDEDDAMC